MTSRQCENTFPTLFLFLLNKVLSKRYCFNKDSGKSHFCCFIPCFLLFYDMFCHNVLILKALDESSTYAKPCHRKNTPNTVSERPSRLTVSVTFDDFHVFYQTCWCSIVGVFLIKTHKNTKFRESFSMHFCIARVIIFFKISDFSYVLYSGV